MPTDLEYLSDESLLAYYESLRRQAAADSTLGRRYRLSSNNAKAYADELQREMQRRGLRFIAIEWR